jgi:hypothetical protein
MIIKEQKTFDDYINDGFREGKPADYKKNIKLYQKIGVDGKVLYKRKDGKPIEIPKTNLDALVGTYTTNVPKIKVIAISKAKDENDEDSLYLSSIFLKKIPQLEDFTVAKLTPKANSVNIFSISSNGVELPDATISFTDNEFTFKYKVLLNQFLTITGKKEQVTTSEPTDKKDDKKKKNPVTSTTTTQDDKKSNIPIVKSKPLYFNNDQKDTTPKKSCNDFPFTLGCVNSKIGDLNAKFFGGNRYDDMYNKQLENFLENKGYFSNSNNELTEKTWNYLMNINIIKESIKKVLKEYINKKK